MSKTLYILFLFIFLSSCRKNIPFDIQNDLYGTWKYSAVRYTYDYDCVTRLNEFTNLRVKFSSDGSIQIEDLIENVKHIGTWTLYDSIVTTMKGVMTYGGPDNRSWYQGKPVRIFHINLIDSTNNETGPEVWEEVRLSNNQLNYGIYNEEDHWEFDMIKLN